MSPDGQTVAFASHKNGNWDLYVLDLRTQETRRLTATPGFEAHPSWSPDGRWIACEALAGSEMDIWILAVDGSQPPLELTHPGPDMSPSWDPQGRRIAFISTADGTADLFLANLDDPSKRFVNLTHLQNAEASAPAFSPDGSQLAYSLTAGTDGIGSIQLVMPDDPAEPAVRLGPGSAPAWSPDGQTILAVVPSPSGSSLVAYSLSGAAALPFGLAVGGNVSGISWTAAGLPGEAYAAGLDASAETTMPTESPGGAGRDALENLPGVSAPNPALAKSVAPAFDALHSNVARATGWDFLSVLDNAFVGINDPLPPGFAFEDWLYTGRAFSFSQAAYTAGWVEVVREDFGGETYWRVYVRANRQDGSQGEPLRRRPWDFAARYTGDPMAYDAGGKPKSAIPTGYYVDFTQLAADEGFQRLPAMSNWRTFYPGARFTEFARTEGLTWTAAMLQLYPASAIVTPTPFRTPTPTPTLTLVPTATPWWWAWRTPTPSRTPTALPSPTP